MKFETQLLTGYEDLHRFVQTTNSDSWCDSGMHFMLWPYYAMIEKNNFNCICVAVQMNGKSSALAIANDVGGTLSYFREPICFSFDGELSDEAREKAFSIITLRLLELMKENALSHLIVHGVKNQSASLSDWQMRLLDQRAHSRLDYNAVIDLSLGEETVWRNLRKSYRSLINWGRKNISLIDINAENLDRLLFDKFQDFHREVAGRVTRPQASWDEMFKLIKQNRAELTMGWYEDVLVAATYIDHDQHNALYATGVYDRNRFDKPISHWPLYHAILRAKARRQQLFDLGSVYQNTLSPKERNIAFFKKGFTKLIQTRTIWTVGEEVQDNA